MESDGGNGVSFLRGERWQMKSTDSRRETNPSIIEASYHFLRHIIFTRRQMAALLSFLLFSLTLPFSTFDQSLLLLLLLRAGGIAVETSRHTESVQKLDKFVTVETVFFRTVYSPDIVPPFTVTNKKQHKPPRKTRRAPFLSTGADTKMQSGFVLDSCDNAAKRER